MGNTTSKGTTKAAGANAAAKAKKGMTAEQAAAPKQPEATTTKAAPAKPAPTPAQVEAAELKAKLEAAKAKAKEEAAAARAEKLRLHNEAVAKRKADLAIKREAKAKEKEEKKDRTPVWVTQLDEHGNPEQVDKNIFPFEIVCAVPGCEEHRWVTKSGLLEATMCKPHARKERRKRRMARVKENGRNCKAIVAEALRLGLFPAEFLKKHGLEG